MRKYEGLKKAGFLIFACALIVSAAGTLWGDGAGFGDKTDGTVIKPAAPAPDKAGARVTSTWSWELVRSGEVVDRWVEHNLCTDEGLEHLLSVVFKGDTGVTAWYVFIFENDYTPQASDTGALTGITECTQYDEATRPAWQHGGVASKSITNSSNKAEFTMNATKTIYGAGLLSAPSGVSKGATSGQTIYNLSKFSSSKAVEDDDVLKVTITLSAGDT